MTLPSLVTGVRRAKDQARGLVTGDISPTRTAQVPSAKVRHSGTPGYNSVRGLLAQRDDTDQVLVFQFNPEEINDVKETVYAERTYTGFSHVDYLWINGGARKISFKLFLDATAGSNTPQFRTGTAYGNEGYESLPDKKPRGVLDDVDRLMSFLYPTVPDGRRPRFTNGGVVPAVQFAPPPVAVLALGEYYLEGIITSVDTTHQLFNQDLISVRCECQVVFNVLEAEVVKINETLRNRTRQ